MGNLKAARWQVFAMDSNTLSGEIPASVNELLALEYLNLRGNRYRRVSLSILPCPVLVRGARACACTDSATQRILPRAATVCAG